MRHQLPKQDLGKKKQASGHLIQSQAQALLPSTSLRARQTSLASSVSFHESVLAYGQLAFGKKLSWVKRWTLLTTGLSGCKMGGSQISLGLREEVGGGLRRVSLSPMESVPGGSLFPGLHHSMGRVLLTLTCWGRSKGRVAVCLETQGLN